MQESQAKRSKGVLPRGGSVQQAETGDDTLSAAGQSQGMWPMEGSGIQGSESEPSDDFDPEAFCHQVSWM